MLGFSCSSPAYPRDSDHNQPTPQKVFSLWKTGTSNNKTIDSVFHDSISEFLPASIKSPFFGKDCFRIWQCRRTFQSDSCFKDKLYHSWGQKPCHIAESSQAQYIDKECIFNKNIY